MKKTFFLLICTIVLFTNVFSQWNSMFFKINDIPANWRKWTMSEKNNPIDTQRERVKKYIDILFTPESVGEISGNFVVNVYKDVNNKKLNINDFILKDNKIINQKNVNFSGLKGICRTVITKVKYQGKIIDYYEKKWYLQGENRIYIIKFGSYNKNLYNKYLPIVQNSLKTFKEL